MESSIWLAKSRCRYKAIERDFSGLRGSTLWQTSCAPAPAFHRCFYLEFDKMNIHGYYHSSQDKWLNAWSLSTMTMPWPGIVMWNAYDADPALADQSLMKIFGSVCLSRCVHYVVESERKVTCIAHFRMTQNDTLDTQLCKWNTFDRYVFASMKQRTSPSEAPRRGAVVNSWQQQHSTVTRGWLDGTNAGWYHD